MTDPTQRRSPSGASMAAAIFGIVTLLINVLLILATFVPDPFLYYIAAIAVSIGNGWIFLGILTGVGALPALLSAIVGHVKASRGAGGMGRVVFAYVMAVVYFGFVGYSLARGASFDRGKPMDPPPVYGAEKPTDKAGPKPTTPQPPVEIEQPKEKPAGDDKPGAQGGAAPAGQPDE